MRPLLPALFIAALAIVTFVGIDAEFGNGDEIIYAQNIREMQASEDWGVLTWQGVRTFQRPTAPFVLSMASENILGGEFGLRFPMAIFSLLTLVLVYLASWKFWRRHDAAFVATSLCAAVPSFHLFSRALLSDPPFVAMCTLALVGTMWALRDTRGILLAAAGLGGAVAVKSLAAGPVGLALAPWLLYAAIHHRAHKKVAMGLGIFAVLALPYYLYSYLRFGSPFVEEHVGWTLGKRLAGEYGDTVGMDGGVWAYPLHLWHTDGALVVLWMIAACAAGFFLWRRGDKLAGCAAATGLAVIALFTLSATRLPHYILAAYPALAIALAGAYAALAERYPLFARGSWKALLATVTVTLVLLGLVRPVPDSHLLRSPAAAELGRKVAALGGDRPLYTLDWYAPACAYYARRPWLALFRSEALADQLHAAIPFFASADNIRAVPPWPTGKYLLAGPKDAVLGAGVPITELVYELDDVFVIVEVTHSPATDQIR